MKSNKPCVPHPCNQSWDAMTPNHQGRFCGSCQKTVVDFTSLSDQEILSFLSVSRGAICGRFRNEQIEKPLTTWQKNLLTIQSKAASIRNKPIRFMSIFLVSLVLLIAGCNPIEEKKTTGEISVQRDSVVQPDSLELIHQPMPKNHGHTTGQIANPDYINDRTQRK